MKKIYLLPFLMLIANLGSAQTVLFSEDFDDETIMDMTGTSSQGIGWTATCPTCGTGDIFAVDTWGTTAQGLRGNDTNGPAVFTATGIDATGMEIIVLEFDYESSGYAGSGNLECHTECSGCSGDPADVLLGSCNNCWDFLSWEISTGTTIAGNVVLGNDCSILDADFIQSTPIFLCSETDLSNLTITISMAMWASAENMIVDNISVTGYTRAEAVGESLLNDAGEDNVVDLCSGSGTYDLFNGLLGTPSSGGIWDGPATTSNGDLGTISLSSITTGDYEYTISTAGTCEDTATITVTNTGIPATSNVSGVADICQGETITITGSGTGSSFEWSDGSTGTTLDITADGNYWFAALSGCGNDTTFFTVNDLGVAPTAGVTGVQDICSGSTVTITGSGSGTFEWSDMSTGNTLDISAGGNYFLAVENACGTDTTFFTINDLGGSPTASVSGAQDICQGSTITVSGGGTGSYEWSDLSTGSTLDISAPGNYSLTVTNACGTDTENFTVGDLGSAPTGVLSGNLFVCDPSATTLLTASGGTSYLWSDLSTNSSNTFGAGSNGYVLIINQCGQDSIPFSITDESVIASFSLSDTTGEEPVTTHSTNNSVNANAFEWDFDNGETSTEVSPSITYSDQGTYEVTLIASNGSCSDTTSVTVIVLDPAPLIIPNIFTPNDDDVNDTFKVVHYSVAEFTGAIYNRWGQKLFENTDQYVFQWDGHNESGKEAPEGTYFYILEATFNNGETQSFSGAFELVR